MEVRAEPVYMAVPNRFNQDHPNIKPLLKFAWSKKSSKLLSEIYNSSFKKFTKIFQVNAQKQIYNNDFREPPYYTIQHPNFWMSYCL